MPKWSNRLFTFFLHHTLPSNFQMAALLKWILLFFVLDICTITHSWMKAFVWEVPMYYIRINAIKEPCIPKVVTTKFCILESKTNIIPLQCLTLKLIGPLNMFWGILSYLTRQLWLLIGRNGVKSESVIFFLFY